MPGIHNGLRSIASQLVVAPFAIAGYGLLDRARSSPGPRIALVLPLRETGHADAVSVLALVTVWLAVFGLAALLAPASRQRVATLALGRAGIALALLAAVQAFCLQLVRQGAAGFDWAAAAGSASVYIAAVCALVATLACAPLRRHRTPPGSSDRRAGGGVSNGPVGGRAVFPAEPMIPA